MLAEELGTSNRSFEATTPVLLQAYDETSTDTMLSNPFNTTTVPIFQTQLSSHSHDQSTGVKSKGVRFSSGSIATLASMVEEPKIEISQGFPISSVEYAASLPSRISETTRLPTTHLPSTNAFISMLSVMLCGIVNPCSLMAVKKSCESAKALHTGDYAQARRDGVAAKQCALGGIMLGVMIIAFVFYAGVINALKMIESRLEAIEKAGE